MDSTKLQQLHINNKHLLRASTAKGHQVEKSDMDSVVKVARIQISNFDFSKLNCKGGSQITLTQGMVLEQMSENIAKNIVSNIVKNTQLNDVEKEAMQKSKQTATGLGLGSLSSCCFLCIACAGAAYYAKGYVVLAIGLIWFMTGIAMIYPWTQEEKEDEKKLLLIGWIVNCIIGVAIMCVGGYLIMSSPAPSMPDFSNMKIPQQFMPQQPMPQQPMPQAGGTKHVKTYILSKMAKRLRNQISTITN